MIIMGLKPPMEGNSASKPTMAILPEYMFPLGIVHPNLYSSNDAAGKLDSGEWNHVVFTGSGGKLRLFMNGWKMFPLISWKVPRSVRFPLLREITILPVPSMTKLGFTKSPGTNDGSMLHIKVRSLEIPMLITEHSLAPSSRIH